MWLFKLTILLAWVNPGPILNNDGHNVTLATTSAQITLDGFTSQAACLAYVYKPEPTLKMPDGTQMPIPLTETHRSCAGYTKPSP